MRRFRGFARRAKRSVSWARGISSWDGTVPIQTRLWTFSAGPIAGVRHSSTLLVDNTDINEHGGEDTVLERVRGRLVFHIGQTDVGAALDFHCLFSIVQLDASATGAVNNLDFTSSEGLGFDQILWQQYFYVSRLNLLTSAVTASSLVGQLGVVDVDCKAKRKLTRNRLIYIDISTTNEGAVVVGSCRSAGALRVLLKRPR